MAAKDLYKAKSQDEHGRRRSDSSRYLDFLFFNGGGWTGILIIHILDAVPQSLISALAQRESDAFHADKRPTKRLKVSKSGPYRLAQEKRVSTTGIPLGYIPLARLALRLVSY